MWVMLAMFVDLPIIDVLGVFAYSIILLGITVFKSLIIMAIISILIVVGIFVLVMDSLSPNKGGFSRFLYRNFISCENSPFAWYKNSRYDLENKCSRGFFCNLNCGTNYRLSENGMYCERAPTNVPYFCPQPLLYKTYRDDRIKGRKKILSFFINESPKILLSNSDKQIESLRLWILWIAERDNIDVRAGLVEEVKKKGADGFEFNEDAYYGKVKGMWTHTNTRKDKFDMFPQPELLDMLVGL